jgi:hypothetical protein
VEKINCLVAAGIFLFIKRSGDNTAMKLHAQHSSRIKVVGNCDKLLYFIALICGSIQRIIAFRKTMQPMNNSFLIAA